MKRVSSEARVRARKAEKVTRLRRGRDPVSRSLKELSENAMRTVGLDHVIEFYSRFSTKG